METKDIEKIVRPNILAMAPYSTARDECEGSPEIFLDANESPYDNGFNRYPDPHQKRMKKAVAAVKGIREDHIFLGNGSDEAIDLAYRVFCRPGIDNAVSIAPTYGMYGVAAATNDVEFREVSLGKDFSLEPDALLAAADANSRLLFICSPNNPTGNSFPREQIERIIKEFNGIVVLDEAYADFSSQGSFLRDIDRHPNLIILQTFSKAWGMAGLRVGMAFASPYIIRLFSNVKYPYNINGLTQEIVTGKLLEAATLHVREIVSERARISEAIAGYPGIMKVYPSDANFILVRCIGPKDLYNALMEAGIIVRDRSGVRGCEGCLRISIGTASENSRLIRTVAAWSASLYPGDRISGNASCPVSPESPEGICTGGTAYADGNNGTGTNADRCDNAPVTAHADSTGAAARRATVSRTTSETGITAIIDLDGKGPSYISTGIGFFDHMLDQIVHHSGISMLIEAKGDLDVDEHHTIEDVAIVLGKAISEALGDKTGIGRYGFVLPMDESEASVLLDFGGRTDFRWDAEFSREKIGDMPTEMFPHFFKSLAETARCNLHISARGENEHHKIEGIFKAFARALKMAVAREKFPYSLPSSKGLL